MAAMQRYHYIALDEAQHLRRTGWIESASEDDAAALLRARSWYVVRLRRGNAWEQISQRKLGARTLALFTQQWATLLHAGIDVLTALRLLSETGPPRLQQALTDVSAAVETGDTLRQALQTARAFPPLLIALVEAGEAAGVLAENLTYASLYYRNQLKLQRLRREAYSYPLLVMLAGLLVGGISVIWILPTFANLFADLGAQPSAVTQTVLTTAQWFHSHVLLIALALFLVLGVIVALAMTPTGRMVVARQADRFTLFRAPMYARMAQVQALLLKSGLDLAETLRLTAAVTNPLYRERLLTARTAVRNGRALETALQAADITAPVYLHMVRVGTESGRLEELLAETAAYYEEESARSWEQLKTWLGPVLLLATGLWVGFLMYSILLPIIDVVTAPM
ncbi:MAG: type II secretion system F family protein [Negativicoccus succinicivorans]|nr:type II secretion system F family protein [Negativicoccus succinicivorans]